MKRRSSTSRPSGDTVREARPTDRAHPRCGLCCAVATLALATVACAPERATAIDPAQCRSIVDQGGTSSAYTGCLLDRAKDKTVGGMPVLSERVRTALNDRDNDPCLSAGDMTQTDLLACELGRPPRPAPASEPQAHLPLIIVPAP
jgi:hypothetical protein